MSIEAKIQKYGIKNPKKVYKYVKTYENLLESGIAFLNRRMSQTYSYMGYFGEANSDGEDHIISKESLIQLHQKGIFTIDGQINRKFGVPHYNEESSTIQQKSYLRGYMTKSMVHDLLPKLLADKRIYVACSHPDKKRYWANYPKYRYIVTQYIDDDGEIEDFSALGGKNDRENEAHTEDYEHLYKVVKKLVFFEVAVREYGFDERVEDIILEYL